MSRLDRGGGRRTTIGVAVIFGAVGSGCGGRPAGEGTAPRPTPGEYEIRVLRPDGAPFEGLMVITNDTLVVVPRITSCRVDPAVRSQSRYQVLCDDVRLSVDRFGAGPPRVTAVIEVMQPVTRKQCVAWTVVNGRQVCTAYQEIVIYERRIVSARAVVNRASPP